MPCHIAVTENGVYKLSSKDSGGQSSVLNGTSTAEKGRWWNSHVHMDIMSKDVVIFNAGMVMGCNTYSRLYSRQVKSYHTVLH